MIFPIIADCNCGRSSHLSLTQQRRTLNSNYQFQEIETPKAPLMKTKESKFNREQLRIDILLFYFFYYN